MDDSSAHAYRSGTSAHKLICFGVGDGWPSLGRSHSSFLYRLGSDGILIDCGESVSRAYRTSGLDWNFFDRILLSHFHADHVGGLFMLIQGCWLMRRERPLTIHLPIDGIEPIQKMLWAACLFEEAFPFELAYEPLESGRAISIGDAKVTPYSTTHLNRLKAMYGDTTGHRFEAFSFLLEAAGRRYGHSADMGAPSDLDSLTQAPLDHLVCELAHFSPDELVAYLGEKTVSQVTLTHLPQAMWKDRESLESDPRFAQLRARIHIASDGDHIPLQWTGIF